MPKKLFYELDEEKRARIIDVALREFAQYPYNESSTNRIVKNAGIGKGSLFKYFQNKKDLYFHILDCIIKDFSTNLDDEIRNLKGDIFERTIQYAKMEFAWCIQNPEKYKYLKKAFKKKDTEIFKETEERYAFIGDVVYYKLFEDMNAEQLNGEKKKLLDILKWFLKGFNEEFIQEMQALDNFNDLQDAYLGRLIEYMEVLKKGLK